jgi:hypothetical protein
MHMGVDRDPALHVHVQQVCCGVHGTSAMDVTNTHMGASQQLCNNCCERWSACTAYMSHDAVAGQVSSTLCCSESCSTQQTSC